MLNEQFRRLKANKPIFLCHYIFLDLNGLFVSQITIDMFGCRIYILLLSLFMTYHKVYNDSNTTGTTNEAATVYPSGPSTCGYCLIFSFLCQAL